jgi:amidase
MKPSARYRTRIVACSLVLLTIGHVAHASAPKAGARTFDLQSATIADINAAIDAGALSSEKLVQMYLKRIEAYDKQGPKINSVITMNSRALDEARALDVERKATGRRSPLHGIPVVIKDLVDLQGFPTTAGFKPFGSPIPEKDAAIVARLKASGAVILAKVATVNWFGADGFGPTHPIGATLNPYNFKYSPGGSSNGTGASMASWFATVGVGTDTGGSVQNPSANNAVTGMVATQGLVSRTGIVPRGPTHDRAGPMGRSVYDISVLLNVLAGFDPEDLDTYRGIGKYPDESWTEQLAKASLKGQRIGVLREAMTTKPDNPEVLGIFENALEDMRKGGAEIVDPVLSGIDLAKQASSGAIGVSLHEVLLFGDVYLARLGPNRPYKTMREFIAKVGKEKFSDRYVNALDIAPPDQNPEYARRYRAIKSMRELIESLADKHDLDAFVILYRSPPTLADPPEGAPTNGQLGGNLTSVTGLPGVIVPAGFTKENLPIGLQFLGKSFSDERLLQVAHGYEQATKKRKSPSSTPPLPGEKFQY